MPARKKERGARSARQILASELARLREESGLSLADLAARTTYDRVYLHKLERGERIGSPDVMTALDTVYGVKNHLCVVWEVAQEGVVLDKYRQYMQLEREAAVKYEYNSMFIPGLLQTEGYARALFATARPTKAELEARVAQRMERQDLIRRTEGLHYRTILDEAVLRRAPEDMTAWQGQLRALLAASEQSNIVLQVLPFSAGLQGLSGGSTTLLWLPEGTTVAYVEGSTFGRLYESPKIVDHIKLSFDLMRDSALSVSESRDLISRLLEEHATGKSSAQSR
jgi:transcriptional regulator with XRE-family HTH domain